MGNNINKMVRSQSFVFAGIENPNARLLHALDLNKDNEEVMKTLFNANDDAKLL